jgi:hypothetical protein
MDMEFAVRVISIDRLERFCRNNNFKSIQYVILSGELDNDFKNDAFI